MANTYTKIYIQIVFAVKQQANKLNSNADKLANKIINTAKAKSEKIMSDAREKTNYKKSPLKGFFYFL